MNCIIFLRAVFLSAPIVGLSRQVMHNANEDMMPTQTSVERAMARD